MNEAPPEIVKTDADKAIWRAACEQAARMGKGQDKQYKIKLFKQIKKSKNDQDMSHQTKPESKKEKSKSQKKKKDLKDKDKNKTSAFSANKVADILEKTADFIETAQQRYEEVKKTEKEAHMAVMQDKKDTIREAIRQSSGEEPTEKAVEKLARLDEEVLETSIYPLAQQNRSTDMAEPADRSSKEAGSKSKADSLYGLESGERLVEWSLDG